LGSATTSTNERKWALEQFGALMKSGAVPKDQEWIQDVLEFLVVHGYFVVNKKIKSTSRGAVSLMHSRPVTSAVKILIVYSAPKGHSL
jgi:DNA polymerase phi